jgi:hypothetical protein
MMLRQTKIDLDDAQTGMVLAEPVVDRQGGVLLPQQTELTPDLLKSLRRRGIPEIVVVDDSMSAEELAAQRARAVARLESLFRAVQGEPGAQALKDALLDYRVGGQP